MLVPELQFKQFKNETLNKAPILQAVQRPEQREMVKKYNVAQQIIHDVDKPNDLQMSEYNEHMQDFSLLKDRMKGARQPPLDIQKLNQIDHDVVETMPASLQSSARVLLNRIKGNDDIISWTPSGEVSIHGEKLRGSNIVDLVGDVLRGVKTENPDRHAFLQVLAELNTPTSLIKNKSALRQFQKRKNVIRPKGIPQHQLTHDDEKKPQVKWTKTK